MGRPSDAEPTWRRRGNILMVNAGRHRLFDCILAVLCCSVHISSWFVSCNLTGCMGKVVWNLGFGALDMPILLKFSIKFWSLLKFTCRSVMTEQRTEFLGTRFFHSPKLAYPNWSSILGDWIKKDRIFGYDWMPHLVARMIALRI